MKAKAKFEAIKAEAAMKMLYGSWQVIKIIAAQEELTTIEELTQFIDTMSAKDLEKYSIKKEKQS